MVQVQHRPSTRVTPQQRKRPQTHKNYDGKGPRKTPNMRLHAAHTEVCERLCMQGPCRPPCRETAADTMGAASGARGSWLRCGREQTTATAASDGQPVRATDPRRYAARVPRYIGAQLLYESEARAGGDFSYV